MRYVNAGHIHRSWCGSSEPNAPIEELSAGGMVIGMFPFASYEESMVYCGPETC